jgi:predicted ATPase
VSSLADVGFGTSQLLPIIIEGLYAPEGALIVLEQPEIHLHPAAQAQLGDLLIDIAGQKKSLIVETHSEHLLGRIQTRIAEGDLKESDVAVYFFEPGPEGTQIKQVTMNADGQFEGWPEGFFEEGFEEALKHTEAMRQRRLKEKAKSGAP